MSDEELIAYIMGESEELLELEAEDVSDAGAEGDEHVLADPGLSPRVPAKRDSGSMTSPIGPRN